MTEPEAREVVPFEEFVVARARHLWRVAWLLTGDAQRAEDLVQTALLKCWGRWERIEPGAHEAYVRRALVTTYTDWWRRRWNGELASADVVPLPTADDAALVAERRDLVRALERLPRSQRAVLVLRYFEDLTEVQTAEALGISVGTVKSHAWRGLAALRASPLVREGFG